MVLNVNYRCAAIAIVLLLITACAQTIEYVPPPATAKLSTDYVIGPGDSLQIFVWRNNEVSTTVPVRPDGKISTPLVEDMIAIGKTPTQLARDLERELSVYLKEPLVTVIVRQFIGPFDQQIRVVGQATKPTVLSYQANMTLLDVMIAVGGLTEFADGNRASIVRFVDGTQQQFFVKLDSLIRDGDITSNVAVLPGDIIIIPESWF